MPEEFVSKEERIKAAFDLMDNLKETLTEAVEEGLPIRVYEAPNFFSKDGDDKQYEWETVIIRIGNHKTV